MPHFISKGGELRSVKVVGNDKENIAALNKPSPVIKETSPKSETVKKSTKKKIRRSKNA